MHGQNAEERFYQPADTSTTRVRQPSVGIEEFKGALTEHTRPGVKGIINGALRLNIELPPKSSAATSLWDRCGSS